MLVDEQKYGCAWLKKGGLALIFLSITLILLSFSFYSFSFKHSHFFNNNPERFEFDDDTRKIFGELYNYNFKQADSLSLLASKSNGNWGKMIRANYLWWLLMSGEEKNSTIRNEFTSTLNSVIASLKHQSSLSQKDLFIIISAQALKARLNLLDGNYFKGLVNVDNTIHFIERSLGLERHSEPFAITSGLLYYFAEYTVIKYPFTKLYFKGIKEASMAKGLGVLERASFSKDQIVNTEGNYFLVKIYQEVENKPALALPHLKKLCEYYPQNILYWYQWFDCELGAGNLERAQKILPTIHFLSLTNKTLTENQQKYFIARAQERLARFYKTQK